LFFFSFIFCVIGDRKINLFQNLIKHDGPLIKFTTDTYKELVLEGGREYGVFVFFTTSSPRHKCGPCVSAGKELATFATSYEKHFGGTYNSEEFLRKPFFIASLEYDTAPDIFQQYKFQTVPHFIYFPPGAKKSESINEENTLRVQQPSAENFAEFVGSKAGVEIPIYRSPLMFYVSIFLSLVLLFIASRMFKGITTKLKDPMLWFVLAVGGYWFVMAGITYDFLRKPPWADVQWSGQVVYISPHARTQYVAEGFIIATLLTLTGLLFVIIGDLIPKIKSTKKQILGFGAACVGLFACLTLINNIFVMKYHMAAFHMRLLSFGLERGKPASSD